MSTRNCFNDDEFDFATASIPQVSQWCTGAIQQADPEEQRTMSGRAGIHLPDNHLLWSRVLFT